VIAPSGSDLEKATHRPLSFVRTVKAVAWSFLGIRKRAGYEQDVEKLNPFHVIVAGIVAAVLFVLSLVWLVNWVVTRSPSGS
jgi:hypothetical protein